MSFMEDVLTCTSVTGMRTWYLIISTSDELFFPGAPYETTKNKLTNEMIKRKTKKMTESLVETQQDAVY